MCPCGAGVRRRPVQRAGSARSAAAGTAARAGTPRCARSRPCWRDGAEQLERVAPGDLDRADVEDAALRSSAAGRCARPARRPRSRGITVRTSRPPYGCVGTVAPTARAAAVGEGAGTRSPAEPFGTRGGWISRSIASRDGRSDDDATRGRTHASSPRPEQSTARSSRSARPSSERGDAGRAGGQPQLGSSVARESVAQLCATARGTGTACSARSISSAPVRPCSSASGCRMTPVGQHHRRHRLDVLGRDVSPAGRRGAGPRRPQQGQAAAWRDARAAARTSSRVAAAMATM